MTIACLAWGSLEWDPRDLKIERPWMTDGPILPVEYLRQSLSKHLTLVLTGQGTPVTTLWAKMSVMNLADAVESLRLREGRNLNERNIGRWPSEHAFPFLETVKTWASTKSLSGVVWTALPPRFANTENRAPTAREAVAYLAALDRKSKAIAETYVRKTPAAVRTTYRALFEQHFGWMPE